MHTVRELELNLYLKTYTQPLTWSSPDSNRDGHDTLTIVKHPRMRLHRKLKKKFPLRKTSIKQSSNMGGGRSAVCQPTEPQAHSLKGSGNFPVEGVAETYWWRGGSIGRGSSEALWWSGMASPSPRLHVCLTRGGGITTIKSSCLYKSIEIAKKRFLVAMVKWSEQHLCPFGIFIILILIFI